MAVGLLGCGEGRAQQARTASVGDAGDPVLRASLQHSSLVALSRRMEGSEESEGGTEQCRVAVLLN